MYILLIGYVNDFNNKEDIDKKVFMLPIAISKKSDISRDSFYEVISNGAKQLIATAQLRLSSKSCYSNMLNFAI